MVKKGLEKGTRVKLIGESDAFMRKGDTGEIDAESSSGYWVKWNNPISSHRDGRWHAKYKRLAEVISPLTDHNITERITQITVLPRKDEIFSEHGFTVTLDDEAGGGFIVIESLQPGYGRIAIDPDNGEWDKLKGAVDKMMNQCRKYNNDIGVE